MNWNRRLSSPVCAAPKINEATLDLIEIVSGRPWWIAMRMIYVAEHRWGVIGTAMIQQGIDFTRISLAAWMDVAWLTMFTHMDEKKWTMFASQMEAPPPHEAFTSLMQG